MSLQAVVLVDVHPSVILVTCLGAPWPFVQDSRLTGCQLLEWYAECPAAHQAHS